MQCLSVETSEDVPVDEPAARVMGVLARTAFEGGCDAVGDGDPVPASAGLRGTQGEVVVVDCGQDLAHEQHPVRKVDIVPLQAERFALAHPSADDQLDQVGEQRVGAVAVLQACTYPD